MVQKYSSFPPKMILGWVTPDGDFRRVPAGVNIYPNRPNDPETRFSKKVFGCEPILDPQPFFRSKAYGPGKYSPKKTKGINDPCRCVPDENLRRTMETDSLSAAVHLVISASGAAAKKPVVAWTKKSSLRKNFPA